MSIKEVTKCMTLDRIEWKKIIHVTLTNKLRIHSQPQNFGTEALLLLLCVCVCVYSLGVWN